MSDDADSPSGQTGPVGRTGQTGPVTAAQVPAGLVDAVVHMVGTGAVPLGAYTLAELASVDAVVDFLEAAPDPLALAEAVRSLSARRLVVAAPDGQRLHVRGDLGIALAFQQRARAVLDARVTGTAAGEHWRVLLLPQPEPVTLEVTIDALGVHELTLLPSGEAVDRLRAWLPDGDRGEQVNDVEALLAQAERTALVTVTRYSSDGHREVVDTSTDLVLARHEGHLHVAARDPSDPQRLVPSPIGRDELAGVLAGLLGLPPAASS